MSKDTINVGGEEKVVREDTAKSYRGTVWALLSVLGFIVIVAIMFFAFYLKSATDNKPSETPGQMEQRTRQ